MPLSRLYSGGLWIRKKLYDWGLFHSVRLRKPVISVGNLTVGGTGKTAIVSELLEQLLSKNLKPAVLSRGYGRQTSGALIVDVGGTAADFGDEPLWLARKFPQVTVIVSEDRAEGAILAPQADVFVLDDGFQNKDVVKDVEIVLVDATRPQNHYELMPYGRARLPFYEISNADTVLITRTNLVNQEQVERIQKSIEDQGCIDIAQAQLMVSAISDLVTGQKTALQDLPGNLKVGLVSAIGNPESFENLVRQAFSQGIDIKFHEKFRDHHSYTMDDFLNVCNRAKEFRCDFVFTTEKDAVKLTALVARPPDLKIGVVQTRYKFNPELPDFYDLACYYRS